MQAPLTCACQPCVGAGACDQGYYYTESEDRCLDQDSIAATDPAACCHHCAEGSQTEDGAGGYALALAVSCELCAIGRHRNAAMGEACINGAESGCEIYECQPCEAGRYTSVEGTGDCEMCPPGFFLEELGSVNITACIDCGAGQYSPPGTGDRTLCERCVLGKYAATGVATDEACIPCAAGRYTETEGIAADGCLACDPGTYNGEVGATTFENCTQCVPGRYSQTVAAIANTTCIACAEGKYGEAYANSNATGCVDCAAGRYGDVLGAGRAELCEACGPARYSNTLDGTPPGNANPRGPGEGWMKCEFCPPSQTPNADQTACINAFCSEFIKGEPQGATDRGLRGLT